MSTTWILVANGSVAYIYETQIAQLLHSNGSAEDNIHQIQKITHDESRQKVGDLVSDRNGNFKASGHGSFVEATDPKKHELTCFAKELLSILEHNRIHRKFDKLVVVASPHFHGILNKYTNHMLSQCVTHDINKDYTHLKGRPLAKILRENF